MSSISEERAAGRLPPSDWHLLTDAEKSMNIIALLTTESPPMWVYAEAAIRGISTRK